MIRLELGGPLLAYPVLSQAYGARPQPSPAPVPAAAEVEAKQAASAGLAPMKAVRDALLDSLKPLDITPHMKQGMEIAPVSASATSFCRFDSDPSAEIRISLSTSGSSFLRS